MPAYNIADFDPPAPVALVSFVNPDTGQRIDGVPMLLDTGGDFLVARTSHGVIGRNILNHLRLMLDGPTLQWEVQ